jgi:hypothetical protein
MESVQNLPLLERLRELVPIADPRDPRPSRLSKDWHTYEANDPHPIRPNTSEHYRATLKHYGFSSVEFEELGIFSRLDRLLHRSLRAQRVLHEVDYALWPFIPFHRTLARNIVITARK